MRRFARAELSILSPAVWDIDIAAGAFQRAILKTELNEYPFVENRVLPFKCFLFVPRRLGPPEIGSVCWPARKLIWHALIL